MSKENISFTNVTKNDPCSICEKPDWCARSSDRSMHICRRKNNGDCKTKIDSAGAEYWLYTTKGSTDEPYRHRSHEKISFTNGSQSLQRPPPSILNRAYSSLLNRLILFPGHKEDLKRRGLSDFEIEARGYKSLFPNQRTETANSLADELTPDVFRTIPGFYVRNGSGFGIAGAPGLLIPCRDLNGRLVALKVRSASPGPNRYTYLSSKSFGGSSPGAPIHVPISNDEINSDILRLTEGELKADIATALSTTLTISVPGVNAWRNLIPVVQEINPKKVFIAFDMDWKTNDFVHRALIDLACCISTHGFQTEIETWS